MANNIKPIPIRVVQDKPVTLKQSPAVVSEQPADIVPPFNPNPPGLVKMAQAADVPPPPPPPASTETAQQEETPPQSEQPGEEVPPPAEQTGEEVPDHQPEETTESVPEKTVGESTPENVSDALDAMLTNGGKLEDDGDDSEDAELADAPDLDLNQVMMGKVSELTTYLAKYYKTKEQVDKAKKDPHSLISRILAILDHGWGSSGKRDYENILARNNAFEGLCPQKEEDVRDGRPSDMKFKQIELSGDDAAVAIDGLLGGLYRLNLLHSGFWIAIRAPYIDELQELFTSIDLENKTIGYMIGGHFALIPDVYLKQKLIEFLATKKMIRRSNFAKFNDANALMRNISFLDYDAIVHAIVTLISRSGFRMRIVCPCCNHQSVEQNIDIASTKFVNRNLLTPMVRKWWGNLVDPVTNRAIVHTEETLRRYREEIRKSVHTISRTVDTGFDKKTVELDIAEPTFSKYCNAADKLIARLNASIDAVANGDSDKAELVRDSMQIHGYQLIAPWVNELRIKDADGNVVLITHDIDQIINYLDTPASDDAKFMFNELHDFLSKVKFNYYGLTSIKCPNCGAEPDEKMKNFYPLELQIIFFGLFFRYLRGGQ